jgi:hypothetical protein
MLGEELLSEGYARAVGLILIALAIALSASFTYLFLYPPSSSWRPPGMRGMILVSALGLSIVIAVLGASLMRPGSATRA